MRRAWRLRLALGLGALVAAAGLTVAARLVGPQWAVARPHSEMPAGGLKPFEYPAGEVSGAPGDLASLYQAYDAAEAEAWRVSNSEDAPAIAAAAAARRAAQTRAVAALGAWADAATPPGALLPAIETALLARRAGDETIARKALDRLVEMVPPAHDGFGIVQLTAGALAEENGEAAAAAGDYERAAGSLDFIARDQALLRLGEVRAALGDSVRAVQAMQEVLTVDPPSVLQDRARAYLAAARLRVGDYDGAELLSSGIAGGSLKGADRAAAMLLVARIQRGRGQAASARRQYEQLFREFPALPLARDAWDEFVAWMSGASLALSANEKLAGSQVLLRSGREPAGLDLLHQLESDPAGGATQVDAAEKEAAWLYGRRRYDDARQVYLHMEEFAGAARLPGRRADALIGVARTYRNAGNIPEMTRAYQSVAADTSLPTPAARATWELAREYKSQGRFADCETVLTQYITNFPKGDDILAALLLRGLCRFIQGKMDPAQEDFRALGRQSDRRFDREAAGYWSARARLEENDTPGALASLRAAITYDLPDGYYGYRARALLERLSPGDSLVHWYPAPAYDPSRDPFVSSTLSTVPAAAREHYQRGQVLARAGFGDDAQAEFSRAADLDPGDGVFLEMISGVANRLGLYSFSMSMARRALARADSKTAEARLWRYVYALGHFDLIEPAAASNGLDPMLVAALIRQESLFDERALSRAGAKGLMQLMLPTARMVARARGEVPPDEDDLYRPELSVAYGTHYLRTKLAEFGDNVEVALAAYNAGELKAREWEGLLARFDPDLFMELIDYSETKDYVRRVRYNQDTFHLFYDPRPAGH